MYVYLVGDNNKQKEIGNPTKQIYIPKKGDRINCGYKPYAEVTQVSYNYDENLVYVIVDGPLL